MVQIQIRRKTSGDGLGAVAQRLSQAAAQGVRQACGNTANYAYLLKNRASGGSDGGILAELVRVDQILAQGRVYTDFFHAGFLEYGTGIHMDPNGPGHLSARAAAGLPWFVHTDMADLSRYPFPVIETPTGDRYYIIHGTQPHPFMHPAAFEMRMDNALAVAEAIRAMFKEAER